MSGFWWYLLLFLILLLLINLYFRLAKWFRIVDEPNERSSHQHPTIGGAGVIIYISWLIFFLQSGISFSWFFLGATIIAIVSFLDDIIHVPTIGRILAHLIGVLCLLMQIGAMSMDYWVILIYIIMMIGTLNAFNFMDGINGITGIYSLVTVATLWYINQNVEFIINTDLILYTLLSLSVLGIYNFRNTAICFPGDIGSVAAAFLIIFLIGKLILSTGNYIFILLLAVYGVDSVLTIIHRLMKKENIFRAHRSHLYQYYANIVGANHLKISLVYGLIQVFTNFVILYNYQFLQLNSYLIATLILSILGISYIYLKYTLEQRLRQAPQNPNNN
ncbi:MAG: UDP-GlcNAc--UDP-phosphate GlcNAc-1-phosphate transferase [Bacteroidetes bacterium]|nr:UDP-GlcNAc--UDP-phosphate GlcNAc-1-phosphate transferase [Bacteroidota bacterium]